MNWSALLQSQIESEFNVSHRLMNLAGQSELNWKPSMGKNWMTLGQLLRHMTDSCGAPIKGFITGDWGMPDGVDLKDLSPEEMLPPAEKMPAIEDVENAKNLLMKDKQLALDMLAQCSEDDLANKTTTAPWDASEMVLGQRLLQMITHLSHHKCQLFLYLKLLGQPVNTSHLWG